MKLKVKQKQNEFKINGWPLLHPHIPTFRGDKLCYTFKLSDEWEGETPLTDPPGFGVKLPAIGAFNYHKSGANFAIIKENGSLFLYPRFYDNGQLHALKAHGWNILTNRWITCEIEVTKNYIYFYAYSLYFTLIAAKVGYISLKSNWITPAPYIGTTNYNGQRFTAAKDLTMELKFNR